MIEAVLKTTQLKRELLRSYLLISSLGFITLIIFGSVSFWLKVDADKLALENMPKITALNELQIGIQRSMANLREWAASNNQELIALRKKAWMNDIYPALGLFKKLNNDSVYASDLNQLTQLLNDLKMWQWHIEDVANTLGNLPAKQLYAQNISPLIQSIILSAKALTEIEIEEHILANSNETLYAFNRLQVNVLEMDNVLTVFLDQGKMNHANIFSERNKIIAEQLSTLATEALFSKRQMTQFSIIQSHYKNYTNLANQAVAMRKSTTWNVAAELFETKVLPIEAEINQLLGRLSQNEHQATKNIVDQFNLISRLLPWLMIALLVMMIYFARRFANKGSKRFITPVILLEKQNQLKTDLTAFSNHIQGAANLNVLSQLIISGLATKVNALSGALYSVDVKHNSLNLSAGYALADTSINSTINYAEGLVGQVWASNKAMEIKPSIEHSFNIKSSLLEVTPSSLFILPIEHENKVVAVIELAFLTPMSAYFKEFIEKNVRQVGVALHLMNQHHLIQKSLEESQAQAEELQAQQEELRVTNEEIKSKSDALSAQQEELRITNDDLTELMKIKALQAQELEAAKQESDAKAAALEEASRYKSEFLANMSHELRTPLNSLLILAGSLAANDDGNLNDEEVESAQVIKESGTNLLNLINDILDISKIEAGQMGVLNERMLLPELTGYLNRHFNHVAKQRNIRFSARIEENVPHELFTDQAKLNQILTNLIGNAIKFTHQGSVTVTVSMCSSTAILAGSTKQLIAFAVADTGVGIEEGKKEHIFQAFQQADGSTSRHYGGTGLGLSISVNFARLLGGDILLESEQGKGSVFTLYVPYQSADSENKNVAPLPALKKNNPVKVEKAASKQINTPSAPPFTDDRDCLEAQKSLMLVIEDDAKFSKILFDACHKRGAQALIAPDGETGLLLAKKYSVKGIILDMMLPGMDGRAVLKSLKALPGTANIPVHVLSAMDGISDVKNLGALDVLTKPVSEAQIATVIKELAEHGLNESTNVLVVEDDTASLKAMDTLLKRLGVNAEQASTPDRAIELLTNKNYGLIILDLGLPDMDGCALLKKIDSIEGMTIPHVIVYTGKELTDEDNECLQAYTGKIIIKSARSPERLADEVSLFLHALHQPEKNHTNETTEFIDFSQVKALIVDDDMRNTFALSKVLRKQGMQVLMAPSGEKALSLIDEHEDINIVLMDIMMPEMDGYEASAAIRAKPTRKNLPIIALTAKAMPGDKEKCLAAGANDYLSKPIDMDKLFTMMQLWLTTG